MLPKEFEKVPDAHDEDALESAVFYNSENGDTVSIGWYKCSSFSVENRRSRLMSNKTIYSLDIQEITIDTLPGNIFWGFENEMFCYVVLAASYASCLCINIASNDQARASELAQTLPYLISVSKIEQILSNIQQ